MLFAENEVSLWQAIIVLLGGGGAGIFGKWIFDVWRTRKEDHQKEQVQNRVWQKEDRKESHDYLLEIIAQWKADYSRQNERANQTERDFQERMRDAERRINEGEHKRWRCEKRLTKTEAEIENIHWAAERYNERLKPDQPKFTIRKFDPDDDSELDSPVQPHGPGGGSGPTPEDQPL